MSLGISILQAHILLGSHYMIESNNFGIFELNNEEIFVLNFCHEIFGRVFVAKFFNFSRFQLIVPPSRIRTLVAFLIFIFSLTRKFRDNFIECHTFRNMVQSWFKSRNVLNFKWKLKSFELRIIPSSWSAFWYFFNRCSLFNFKWNQFGLCCINRLCFSFNIIPSKESLLGQLLKVQS